MKDWHKLKPELFKKNPYYFTGCDSYDEKDCIEFIVNHQMPAFLRWNGEVKIFAEKHGFVFMEKTKDYGGWGGPLLRLRAGEKNLQ